MNSSGFLCPSRFPEQGTLLLPITSCCRTAPEQNMAVMKPRREPNHPHCPTWRNAEPHPMLVLSVQGVSLIAWVWSLEMYDPRRGVSRPFLCLYKDHLWRKNQRRAVTLSSQIFLLQRFLLPWPSSSWLISGPSAVPREGGSFFLHWRGASTVCHPGPKHVFPWAACWFSGETRV